jgi:hypothetical protein
MRGSDVFPSSGNTSLSWLSEKQTCMALSSAEAKYVVACSTCGEAVWLRKLFAELFDLELEETCIFYDKQSCIKLLVNPMCHDKSKHIEIKYHYIREMIQKGAVKLQYVPTDEQVADVLTKPLSRVKFKYFKDKLGVVQKDFPS